MKFKGQVFRKTHQRGRGSKTEREGPALAGDVRGGVVGLNLSGGGFLLAAGRVLWGQRRGGGTPPCDG